MSFPCWLIKETNSSFFLKTSTDVDSVFGRHYLRGSGLLCQVRQRVSQRSQPQQSHSAGPLRQSQLRRGSPVDLRKTLVLATLYTIITLVTKLLPVRKATQYMLRQLSELCGIIWSDSIAFTLESLNYLSSATGDAHCVFVSGPARRPEILSAPVLLLASAGHHGRHQFSHQHQIRLNERKVNSLSNSADTYRKCVEHFFTNYPSPYANRKNVTVMKGGSIALHPIWSPGVPMSFVILEHFKLVHRRNLVQRMAKKPLLEIHPNGKSIGPWLKVKNFEVFLTLDNKSDWSVSVWSSESW